MDTKKDMQKIFQDVLLQFWDKSLEPSLDKILGRLDGVEGRLDGVEGQLDGVEGQLDGVEGELGAIKKTLGKKADNELVNNVEESILTRIDKLEENIGKKIEKHGHRLQDHEVRITQLEQASL